MLETELLAAYFGNEDLLYQKEAGVADAAASFAAAALLMRLLDSGRSSPREVREASRQLGPTLRHIEATPHVERKMRPEEDFRRGPRLFVSSESMDQEGEMGVARYRMGFVPHVPLGMDHGMVRLASKEAGMFGRAAAFLQRRFPKPAPPKPPPTLSAQRTPGGGAELGPAPAPPAPTPAPAPPAPTAPAPAQPTPSSPQGTRSKGIPGKALIPGAIALGAGAAAVGLIPKATGAVLDYGEKETVTPWGMQPYGAVRLNHTLNAYGQPMP